MNPLNNETLAELIQLAPDAVIVVDETGAILFANNQVEAVFGYAPIEIMGQKVECLIPETLRKKHVKHRSDFMLSPRIRSMGANLELRGVKKSGESFPVEISLSPLKTENRMLITAAIRDVSEKRQKEKQLVAGNAAIERNIGLERFVYVASHHLQEPLCSLKQLLIMLERAFKGKSEQESHLISRIMDANSNLSSLIQDLLTFTRTGSEKEISSTNCNTVINEIHIDLRALIERTNTLITIKNLLPTLQAYATELKLLFQHLIHNSITFCKIGVPPVITIDVKKKELEWLFSVTDNGIGIEDRFINKLFVVFQRLHNGTEYPGNGIGLAHCKKIVEIHGGNIWIESEYKHGTTVYFTIPCNIERFL